MKRIKLFISIIALFFVFLPSISALAVEDYCIWQTSSSQKNPCDAPGTNTTYFTLDSTGESCQGKPKDPGENICCCQIKDRPGQCSASNPCPRGESCVDSWCKKDAAEAAPLFKAPDLQITIPGLTKKLSDVQCDAAGECGVPWIGQYIQGIYNYALAIVGIIAAIVLMAGGVLWLISAGDASKITQAKELITGSISGLIILSLSYVILLQINPNLTKFIPISVNYISRIDLYSIPSIEQGDAPASAGGSHGVPWYFQCSSEGKNTSYDYDGECDDKSTICTSGCGAVSSLMVLGKLGINLSLATWAQEVEDSGGRTCYNGSNINGLIKAAQKHGLTGVWASTKDQISKALDAGHPVIISVKGPCAFTQGGHYIVLTGWRDKTQEIADVNDPANSSQKSERGSISLKTFNGCKLTSGFYLYK